ncbi:hypothetical protein [Arthrobacter sp. B2a2-09]|uniref:hypothetical protein n=1 Tax=Arthrobacter sp. B2a2-09 TaxID=2952822 RepID=UPI0022CDB5A9|nr:hypothetical protein [Arthrobacter sp. B2a2-09]MCZ9884046.1 hypothetical protein [Arthrobacter sp. B2a2-09]
MTLPAGVTTCDVVFNTPVSFAGGAGSATLTIRPTQTIFWAATGQPLGKFTETVAVNGVPGAITLPVVDQAGFVDSSGNAVKNWAYLADIAWSVNGQYIASHKSFQLATGQSSVVLDLIPDGNVSTPVSAPFAPVTSVNGVTGAVSLTKASLGLGSVDNTPDVSKPVSTAQQAALDAKADAAATVTALSAKQNAADLDAAAAALLNNPASALRAAGNTTFVPGFAPSTSIAYNGSGQVTSATENGITTTYTYNADGTVNTEIRLGKVRTWVYDGSGNPTSSTVV